MPNCAFNAQFGRVEPYVGISILECAQVLFTSFLQFTPWYRALSTDGHDANKSALIPSVFGLINGLFDFLLYFMVYAKIILGTVGGEHSEILFTHVQIANCLHVNMYFFNFLV